MIDDGSGSGLCKPKQRTAAERAAIVAETYAPGATVAGVAKKHGIVASKPSTWRTLAKKNTGRSKLHSFAEIAVLADAPFDGIEIVSGSVSVRLPKSTTPKRIADIAQRLAGG